MSQEFFYAVHRGRNLGVYNSWDECKPQVNNLKDAIFKKFPTREAAEIFHQTGVDSLSSPKYYAITRGHNPGVYNTWAQALDQIKNFWRPRYKRFSTLKDAERFIEIEAHDSEDDEDDEIILRRTHWEGFTDFTPQPTALFGKEFDRLASSQGWERGTYEYRQQKIIAMKKEFEHHYFSQNDPAIKQERIDSSAIKQEDDEEEMKEEPATLLSPEELMLRGHQNLCREVRKTPGETIEDCLRILKAKPYVNIVDLIDCRRAGYQVKTWDSWFDFMDYTMNEDDKRIDPHFAKEDGFLSSLLQNFAKGPRNQRLGRGSPRGNQSRANERGSRKDAADCVRSGRVDKQRRVAPTVREVYRYVPDYARRPTPESDNDTQMSKAPSSSSERGDFNLDKYHRNVEIRLQNIDDMIYDTNKAGRTDNCRALRDKLIAEAGMLRQVLRNRRT